MKYAIFLIGGFVLGFLLFKSCSNESDLQTTVANLKEKLKTEELARESKELEITALNKALDSLATIIKQAKVQIVYRTAEINEAILKDSTKALVEYRRSLQDNGYLPDGTLYLSYREIGLGAILMAKIPKLELQINTCEEQLTLKDEIIEGDAFIKKSYQSSLTLQKQATEHWMKAYQGEQSFWNDNKLWFGIGVVATVATVFLAGLAQ